MVKYVLGILGLMPNTIGGGEVRNFIQNENLKLLISKQLYFSNMPVVEADNTVTYKIEHV